jgi:hypothetical protein
VTEQKKRRLSGDAANCMAPNCDGQMEMARTRLEDFYAGCLVAYAGTLPQWSVPLLSSSSFLELKWSVLMTGGLFRYQKEPNFFYIVTVTSNLWTYA